MEFRYGVWTGVSAYMGADGRQLGEANTRPLVFNREIPAEVQACKYPGNRHGKLINISALRVAMRHFYDASTITVAVRDYHMAQIKQPASQLPGGWDLYAISRAAIALISFRYRYGKTPLEEKVPNDLSSLYKLVTGVFVICREMMKAAYPAVQTNEPISADELYAYADGNHIFRSENDMVCAGSVTKITEFLELANQGRGHAEGGKLHLKGEHDYLAFLQNYVPDVEGWYQYALRTIELDHFIELEVLRRKIEGGLGDLKKLHAVQEICLAQHRYWLELLGDQAAISATDFESGVLARQNGILACLDWAPLKTVPDKLIKARLSQ